MTDQSSVTVEAVNAATSVTVARTMGPVTGTTAQVPFSSGNHCTVGGTASQPCTLGEGSWSVTASYTKNAIQSIVSTAVTLTIDTTAPTVSVTIDGNDHDLEVNDTATVVFNVEANVVGFDFDDDVDHNAGAAFPAPAAFPNSDGDYQATFTAQTMGTYTISVPANSFTDAAGNPNTASNTARIGVGLTDDSQTPGRDQPPPRTAP